MLWISVQTFASLFIWRLWWIPSFFGLMLEYDNSVLQKMSSRTKITLSDSERVRPIPKIKTRTHMDSNNYRGIALRSVFGKLSDPVTLSKYHTERSFRFLNVARVADVCSRSFVLKSICITHTAQGLHRRACTNVSVVVFRNYPVMSSWLCRPNDLYWPPE